MRALLFFHPILNPYPRVNAFLLVVGDLALLFTLTR